MAQKHDSGDDRNPQSTEITDDGSVRSDRKNKKKEYFLEYFQQFKEANLELINSKQPKDADPISCLKRIDKQYVTTCNYLYEARYAFTDILNQLLLINFSHLKDIAVERKPAEDGPTFEKTV